jgi:hypothetical protein
MMARKPIVTVIFLALSISVQQYQNIEAFNIQNQNYYLSNIRKIRQCQRSYLVADANGDNTSRAISKYIRSLIATAASVQMLAGPAQADNSFADVQLKALEAVTNVQSFASKAAQDGHFIDFEKRAGQTLETISSNVRTALPTIREIPSFSSISFPKLDVERLLHQSLIPETSHLLTTTVRSTDPTVLAESSTDTRPNLFQALTNLRSSDLNFDVNVHDLFGDFSLSTLSDTTKISEAIKGLPTNYRFLAGVIGVVIIADAFQRVAGSGKMTEDQMELLALQESKLGSLEKAEREHSETVSSLRTESLRLIEDVDALINQLDEKSTQVDTLQAALASYAQFDTEVVDGLQSEVTALRRELEQAQQEVSRERAERRASTEDKEKTALLMERQATNLAAVKRFLVDQGYLPQGVANMVLASTIPQALDDAIEQSRHRKDGGGSGGLRSSSASLLAENAELRQRAERSEQQLESLRMDLAQTSQRVSAEVAASFREQLDQSLKRIADLEEALTAAEAEAKAAHGLAAARLHEQAQQLEVGGSSPAAAGGAQYFSGWLAETTSSGTETTNDLVVAKEYNAELEKELDALHDALVASNEALVAKHELDQALLAMNSRMAEMEARLDGVTRENLSLRAQLTSSQAADADAAAHSVIGQLTAENDELKQRLQSSDERLFDIQQDMQAKLDSAKAVARELNTRLLEKSSKQEGAEARSQ